MNSFSKIQNVNLWFDKEVMDFAFMQEYASWIWIYDVYSIEIDHWSLLPSKKLKKSVS